MGTRQRAVMSLSVSPDTAKEYKEIAKMEGKTISGLFREMFFFYKQEKLKKEFFALQDCGVEKAKELNISEEEIERLIFAGR
jgi:hypothetical protein